MVKSRWLGMYKA